MDPATLADLKQRACDVAKRAYAPASGFCVGAALLGCDGGVYVGCNVENSSYGLTLCAERGAIAQAIAAGASEFEAVVVHTPGPQAGYPCGACRQVLAEFARPEMTVVLTGEGGEDVHTTLGELLPHAFRFDY